MKSIASFVRAVPRLFVIVAGVVAGARAQGLATNECCPPSGISLSSPPEPGDGGAPPGGPATGGPSGPSAPAPTGPSQRRGGWVGYPPDPVIDPYGCVTQYVPLGVDGIGLLGVASFYDEQLAFDHSYSAWGNSSLVLRGNLPRPDLSGSNLVDGVDAVQPRPGTLPGMYLYSVDGTLDWPDNFYQYGGPVESGPNPQTTAQFGSPVPLSGFITTPPVVYSSNLSGAQLWYQPGGSSVEVKHVDGTIARFDRFQPWITAPSGRGIWRLVEVRDPYDNVATYTYDSKHRLTDVVYPSGLTRTFDYAPSWGVAWGTTYSCLEISYKQGSTPLPDLTWGLVFSGATGPTHGSHFGQRLQRVYSPTRPVLVDPTVGVPHAMSSSSAVSAQIVTQFVYTSTTSARKVTQVHSVHSGTPFSQTLTSPSGLAPANVQEVSFFNGGSQDGRAESQTVLLTGETTSILYPAASRTADLPPMVALNAVEAIGPDGTKRRFEFDPVRGTVYSIITTPDHGPGGMPRAAHVSGENAGLTVGGSNPATTEIEPDSITIYNIFGGACVCQKPTERRIIAVRGAFTETRTTKFEYDAVSKLLTKRSEINPQTGSGAPAEVHWDYSYVRAMASGQLWGAWLPNEEVTPDGTYKYVYGAWLDRANASAHGRIAGQVERKLDSIHIQDSLSDEPTLSSIPIVETLYRNLGNSPGSLPATGNVRGQSRRVVDGDGVATTFEYTTEGWLNHLDSLGSTTRTTFTRNLYGQVTTVSENTTSSVPAVTTLTPINSLGVASASSVASGSTVLAATEWYFDRWGNLAVERSRNLASDGHGPTKHMGTSGARAWVETQYHYHGARLTDVFRDRKPLDEAAGIGQFLRTEFVYSPGRLDHVVHPNGGKTFYVFDGYGSLYRTQTTNPAGAVTVKGPKQFVNPFLEVSASYEFDGVNHLWTKIDRNGAGAITQITEPSLQTVPSGYASFGGGNFTTGGARHEFEIDVLGRVVKAKSFESATLLALREIRYDELGRKIWEHDQALTRALAAMGSASDSTDAGQHYVAWKYQSGKATWLNTVERSGVAPASYKYLFSGLLEQMTDGASSKVVKYTYHGGTPFVSDVERSDVDPVTGTRTTNTRYDVDALGRVVAIKEGPSTAQLVHAYAYSTLGRVDRYTDPAGRQQLFLADGMGRIVEHVRLGDAGDYIRNTTVFEDTGFADGRTKVRRIDGQNHETITHADFAGRPFIVQNPGSTTVPTPSAKNQAMSLYAEYDEASRVKAVHDGDVSIQFTRDAMGRVIHRVGTRLVDHLVSTWNSEDWFRRDALGRIAHTDYWGSDGVSPAFVWGKQPAVQDSIGRTHSERFTFTIATNSIDVASKFVGGNTYRSELDYRDNLTGAYTAPVSLDFAHDAIGRLTQIQWDKAPGGGSAMAVLAEYGWSGGLRRTRTVRYGATAYPQGRSLFSYDDYGRLSQIKDDVWTSSSSSVTKSKFDYEYDAASNLIKERYAKVGATQVGDRFAYDAYHRLESAWMGVTTATMNATGNPTAFSSSQMHEQLTYGLDSANNRTTVTSETGSGSVPTDYFCDGQSAHTDPSSSNRYQRITTGTGGYVELEYDERGNLTWDGNFAYRYDYMNRLQEVWRVAPTAGMAQQGEKYALIESEATEEVREDVKLDVPDLMQRLPREHKDPVFRARLKKALRGGVVRVNSTPQGGGGRPGFLPEPAGMELVAVYVYDGYNRRTMSVVVNVETQLHVWDGWQQVQQMSWDIPTGLALPNKQFVWGSRLDELVSYRRLNGTTWETYFLLHGGQDTAAKLVDSTGTVVEQYEYDPYGRVTCFKQGTSGAWTAYPESQFRLPFLWKGIRLDVETGLLYMRNRHYSPSLGRFLTEDPPGVWMDSGNLGNSYGYCGNNPLTKRDALGLQADVDGALSSVIASLLMLQAAQSNPQFAQSQRIAAEARQGIGSKEYAKEDGSAGGERWRGRYKCNLFVALTLERAGVLPMVKGGMGSLRMPNAEEWHDTEREMRGWEFVDSPRPGDVGSDGVHCGICTGSKRSTSAPPSGAVVENDWGFRTEPGSGCVSRMVWRRARVVW